MRTGQDVLPGLDTATEREWLLADGLGGSASGPVAGPPARRTQTLLTSADAHGRLHTLLLRFDERVTVGTVSYDLAHETAESFAALPWPTWRFRLGECLIERRMLGVRGHSGVVGSWLLVEGAGARIAVSPLLVGRDPNALQPEATELRGTAQGVPGRVQIATLPDRPSPTFWYSGQFLPARVRKPVSYALEHGATEHALVPGHFEATLAPGAVFHVVASTEHDLFRALAAEERLGVPPTRSLAGCVAALETEARERDRRWMTQALTGADFTARQAAAAHGGEQADAARRREPLIGFHDRFAGALARQVHAGLVHRGGRLTLVESLPRGLEHGSSALRAAHALISLRAFDLAREVIRGYVEYLDEGVAPQGFDPADGTPLYGDPAPALWLISASEFHVRRSGDTAFVEAVLAPLESILQAYRSGTRHGIGMDPDGLLIAGGSDEPRAGVNALWYHALIAMAQLARSAGRRESAAFYLAWARDHQTRFNDRLWNEAEGTLRDSAPDALLVASLAPSVLPHERAQRMLARIERERFTPFGLRERAGTTRAGSEWLGPFLLGHLLAHQRSDEARARVRWWISPLEEWIERGAPGIPSAVETGAGAEVAPQVAGDPLSVLAAADLLRLWIEELDHPAPAAG
jgi:hypothetical protein